MNEIQSRITKLEKNEKIKILYAVESGSRAWGFASPDSDYDVRFIYIRNQDWYLSIEKKRDTIEYLEGDYDFSGWDLNKTLELFRKSNPALLEWLRSSIVYKKDQDFIDAIKRIEVEAFNPKSCVFHYLSIANNNYKEYISGRFEIKLKKYFYVLRSIFASFYIIDHKEIPPIEFNTLLDKMNLNEKVKTELEIALNEKIRTVEKDPKGRIEVLDNYIESSILEIKKIAEKLPVKEPVSYEKLNSLFRKFIN